jgi:hypothetical protein
MYVCQRLQAGDEGGSPPPARQAHATVDVTMSRKVLAIGIAVVAVAATVFIWYVEQGKARYDPGTARIHTYAPGASPTELTIFFATGAGDIIEGPSITEEPTRVLVAVRTLVYVPARGTFKNLSAPLGQTTVHLREPLGDRTVIDATTLAPVARSPSSPLGRVSASVKSGMQNDSSDGSSVPSAARRN